MADLDRKSQGLGTRPALLLVDLIESFTDPDCPLGCAADADSAAFPGRRARASRRGENFDGTGSVPPQTRCILIAGGHEAGMGKQGKSDSRHGIFQDFFHSEVWQR